MLKLTPYVSKHPILMSAPSGIIEEIEKACETPEDLAELFILAYNEARTGQEVATKLMEVTTELLAKHQTEIRNLKLRIEELSLLEDREDETVFQMQ